MINQTIAHYTITEKLGEGGMGVVYKARDTILHRTVVLKFLPEGFSGDEIANARFVREARSAALLNHPNICAVYGLHEVEGRSFISMEYIEGETLQRKIPIQDVGTVIAIFLQVARALQEAHEKGVVHRDIKAENVMIDSRGRVKVLDFGLAKMRDMERLTRTSMTMGTVPSMAPEQIRGLEADHRSDIYSLGVLLFVLLTGKVPFRGEHAAAIAYMIVHADPDPIEAFRPDISPELAGILYRMLRKDPDERYQSVTDLLGDLAQLGEETVRDTPASTKASFGGNVKDRSGSEYHRKNLEIGPGRALFHRYWKSASFVAVGLIAAGMVWTMLVPVIQGEKLELNPHALIRVLDVPSADIGYHGLSADGKWTVFPARGADGLLRVYFMSTAGGEARAITTDTLRYINSAEVSPDGHLVVYDALFQGRRTPDIYLISALGGGARVIAEGGTSPRFGPDGSRVYYFREQFDSVAIRGISVWSVSVEGGDGRHEFSDTLSTTGRISLSISPNGQFVAWLRNELPSGRVQEIMVRDLSTGASRQVTDHGSSIDEVCWLTDESILFSSNLHGNTNIWLIPARGGEAQQVTKGSGPDIAVRVSADRSKLLYLEQRDIQDFWVGSLSSGSMNQVTRDSRNKFTPSLSPDGSRLAFKTRQSDLLSTREELYVSSRDGTNLRRLAVGDAISLNVPIWSPDGRHLAYYLLNSSAETASAPEFKAYVVSTLDGSAPRLLAEAMPWFWLDSDSLIIIDMRRTWIAPISGGKARHFFEDSTAAFPVSGGGAVVYLERGEQYTGYHMVRTDAAGRRTGKARRIPDTIDGYRRGPFSASRDFILYWKAGGRLLRYWLRDGRKETLNGAFGNLTPQDVASLAVSGFSDEFIYSTIRNHGRLVMIEQPFQ